MRIRAYGAKSAESPLEPLIVERRTPGPDDVVIEILYCGVCRSDLHTVRGEWPGIRFPSVPGHEIVGRVIAVGENVDRFAVGDLAGVGPMIDSCRQCEPCTLGIEQYCEGPHGILQTYNGWLDGSGENTLGGYAKTIVVDQHYTLAIGHPEADLAAVAPLLCAGITSWSPLRHWKTGPGMTVGIVGLGGLGHLAVKFARALGAHVVAFTSSAAKAEEAFALGAHDVVVSSDRAQMATRKKSLDLILNTVSAPHNLNTYTSLLKREGTMVLVGAPSEPHPSPSIYNLIIARRSIAGSASGSIGETQEMLDFCAEHGIVSDIEIIAMPDIEHAFARLERNDVRYRFVINMATL